MDVLSPVSVVVPVYNAQSVLTDCISSLLQLNYPAEKLQLIFVDNGSTDKSAAILSRYDKQIVILKQQKRGPAAARNEGLRACKNEIVAFTDSDCVVDPDWLRNLIEPLQDPAIGAVGGKILSQPPMDSVQNCYQEISDHEKSIHYYKPPYVITMNWASRISVLNETGYFDEDLLRSEDTDLSFRLLNAGYSFVYQPNAIIYHQNERTHKSLFVKGFQHGFYSIPLLKKHSLYLKQLKHKRASWGPYRMLLSHLMAACNGPQKDTALCKFLFESGKRAGKILGSIRFSYLEI
jgi:cellulose synthase/poly-beta-1,6-N-acetylglucosamine synthase-like glycosyltransferase